MVAGFGLTLYYMCTTEPGLRTWLHVSTPLADATWWGIAPISAGVFGVPAALAVTVLVSLVTPRPAPASSRWVDDLRRPEEGV
jgi:cation/acetate symporter